MAATIAKACGIDSTRCKRVHRLGSQESTVEAATWRTFATATVRRDGSGCVEVRRDGEIIHTFKFGAEQSKAGEVLAREKVAVSKDSKNFGGATAHRGPAY